MELDLTGTQCGLFEVWGSIGQGGMSKVWLARHVELSVPVIIKTPLRTADSPADNRQALMQLRTEARLMARVPSSHVVRAVDVGMHDGNPYLVQEYVDGLDLAELDHARRAALGRRLPLWFVCSTVAEMARALESAHRTGVLHRDVKPSNIFGSPQMGVRLGDFGLAVTRALAGDASAGTLRFVAPELLFGEPATRRSDVYSLGATAYDLFYGTAPFTEMSQIINRDKVRFPQAATAEEAYFQHVVGRMLEPDAASRSANMGTAARLLGSVGQALRPRLRGVSVGAGEYMLGGVRIRCRVGDIALAEVDCIVNSANDEMKMKSGVGAALCARGGSRIAEEALRGGRRALGVVVPTTSGDLRCKMVLHAVSAWKEASCIARTCQRAFLMAEEFGLHTLALPALGTGAAHVSPESCAYAMTATLYWHVLLGGTQLQEIDIVVYDEAMRTVFVEALEDAILGDVDAADEALEKVARDEALEETMMVQAIDPTVAFPSTGRSHGAS
jgi:serine/threonine-protein kinase